MDIRFIAYQVSVVFETQCSSIVTLADCILCLFSLQFTCAFSHGVVTDFLLHFAFSLPAPFFSEHVCFLNFFFIIVFVFGSYKLALSVSFRAHVNRMAWIVVDHPRRHAVLQCTCSVVWC